MIVDSMTHEEVYQELARDREAVTRWWRHQLIALERPMIKRKVFPTNLWFEYTSPRKVRYLFFTRIFDKRMKRILTGLAVIRHTPDGLTAYTNWLGHQKLITPMVLTSHMWKRYRERAGVKKSGIELVKHYFYANAYGKDTGNHRVMARSVRWNGEEHQACCVTDGVLLGQIVNGIYIARTFITYDMCSGKQQEEFESCRKQIPDDMEMYEQAKIHYV